MTRDEFRDIIEEIQDMIGPLDKETDFLDTSKEWKGLMLKSQASSSHSTSTGMITEACVINTRTIMERLLRLLEVNSFSRFFVC